MRNLLFLTQLIAVLFIAPLQLNAQPYPKASYQLEDDGRTLAKWLGSESVLNLTADPAFATVEKIGEKAFAACRSLKKVTLPEKTSSVEAEAFSECDELSEISWNDALVSIGNDAFFACKKLKRVDLKSVQNIGNTAFSSCASLEEVFIPKSVEELGYAAFYNCRSIKSFSVDKENGSLASYKGVLFDRNMSYLLAYPRGNARTVFTVPPTVTIIAGRAFDNCSQLQELTLSPRITMIGKNALFNCSGLQKISIRSSITPELQGDAPLNGIDLANCKLYVPESAIETYREAEVWKNFVHVEPFPAITGIPEDSYLLDENGTTLLRWLGGETEIDMSADPKLSEVEVIGAEAFSVRGEHLTPNMALLSLKTSPRLRKIESVGVWCISLQEIELAEGLEELETAAFSGGMFVREIKLPASLKKVAGVPFYNFYELTTLDLAEESETFTLMDDMLVEKGTNRLIFTPQHRNRFTIQIPNGVKIIGEDAFSDNNFIRKVIVPEGVTTLEKTCFLGCDWLMNVDLPSSLTTIDFRAFARSQLLDSVIVRATTPPALVIGSEGQTPFDRIGDEAVLWVPQVALEAYRANETWSNAFTDIRPLENLPSSVNRPTDGKENITLANHVLNVRATGKISVFNSAGVRLGGGVNNLSVALPQSGGIYLLNIDGRVIKILNK